MTKKRIIYFDYLRFFAAFIIIVLHISAGGLGCYDLNSFEYSITNIGDAVSRWGVPVFVMISGALFLDKRPNLKDIFKKHVLKIIIVIIFWAVAYNLFYYIQTVFLTHKINRDFFKIFSIKTLLNGQTHFWFLYMILGLYLIVPFLCKLTECKKTEIYFLILSFLFSFLIPQCINIAGRAFKPFAESMNIALNNMFMFFVMGYSGYFVLGYFLNTTEIKKNTRIIVYILGIIGAIYTILTQSYDNFNINVLLMSISIFVFFKTHLNILPKKEKTLKLILFLSKCSFGVYLIHPYIIEAVNILFGFSVLSFNPIISIPLLALFVFGISLSISAILNKIPLVKKWIV